MDHRPAGFLGPWDFLARILEWSFPSPGDLPHPGIELTSFPTLARRFSTTEPHGKPFGGGSIYQTSQLLINTK